MESEFDEFEEEEEDLFVETEIEYKEKAEKKEKREEADDEVNLVAPKKAKSILFLFLLKIKKFRYSKFLQTLERTIHLPLQTTRN